MRSLSGDSDKDEENCTVYVMTLYVYYKLEYTAVITHGNC
jgi:hypothetical protein